MNIELQIDDADEPRQRRPLRPPPDFQSWRFRLRLMTLLAALLLVLVLMQEAGKPERWAWMGFDQVPGQDAVAVERAEADDRKVALGEHAIEASILPAIWQQVQDRTAVGHVGDSEAWADAWRKVNEATLADLATAAEVQRVQLMSQPNSYRGRWVKLSGWVRSARFVDRPIAALGQNAVDYQGRVGHYEFWIRPGETNAGPYCIYALELPAGFPDVNDRHVDLNEKVEVVACFFKNRSYVAADKKATICPLLLAASFTRLSTVEEDKVDAEPWIPSVPIMVGIVIAFALLATILARLARTTSRAPRYQPGVQMTNRIHDSLEQLADDPSVLTDREKVIQLERSGVDAADRSENTSD